MKNFRLIFIFLVLEFICLPVMGVTTYLGGSPVMSAAIAGTNEFTPGQDTAIIVTLQNSGVNNLEFTTIGTITRDDIPTTAKLVTVGISAGDAPVIVKSDPQIIGDIKSQGVNTFHSMQRSYLMRMKVNTRYHSLSGTHISPHQIRIHLIHSGMITVR